MNKALVTNTFMIITLTIEVTKPALLKKYSVVKVDAIGAKVVLNILTL